MDDLHGFSARPVLIVQNKHGKKYILKFFITAGISGREIAERIRRETVLAYNIMKNIKHPNIVRIYVVDEIKPTDPIHQEILKLQKFDEYGNYEGYKIYTDVSIPYVIMEYIDGYSPTWPDISPEQCLLILVDLMSMVRVLQKYNLYHGDFQYHNVMYDTVSQRCKLIDLDTVSYKKDTDVYDEVNDVDRTVIECLYNRETLVSDDILHDNGEYEFRTIYPPLTDDTALNKYINYVIREPNYHLPLDHYIRQLSMLLGSEKVAIALEGEQYEIWHYGVKDADTYQPLV